MKGVKAADVEKTQRRDEFVRKMFLTDCLERAKLGFKSAEGFYLPPLSGPLAQKALKKDFKTAMNSQRLFKIRQEAFKACGLTSEGKPKTQAIPLPGVPKLVGGAAQPLAAANRNPNDPLYHVAIVPTSGVDQGNFLKATLELLGQRGLIDPALRVDDIHNHYATVSKYPQQ
jgi:hypothetical protein